MATTECLIKNGKLETNDDRQKRNRKIALEFLKIFEGEKVNYSDVKEILSEVDRLAACYSAVSLPAIAEI